MEEFYREMFDEIEKENVQTIEQVQRIRRELCRKYQPNVFPSMIQILLHADETMYNRLQFLVTKPMRTRSGVAPIALMTKPTKCPHGTCAMCGGGPGSPYGTVPQSYTGAEPATLRGMRNFYDPYLVVFNRLEQYTLLNQSKEKVEIIIMGGTFPATALTYQEEFIMYTFKALNDFSTEFYPNGNFDLEKFKEFFELPGNYKDAERTHRVQKKMFALKGSSTLTAELKKNETAKIRCVGLTIETKPDWALLPHAQRMLEQGCTRVELGLQSVSDDVLRQINRGHTTKESKEAMRILKDLGFKVNAHIMIGLPGQDNEEIFQFFEDPAYRPDMLKIYPCMVMPGTEVEKWWKEGKFVPITTEEAIDVISRFKARVPEYVRIMRVQRDIPTKRTLAGVDRTNLRQMIRENMKRKGLVCHCISCSEIKSQIINPCLSVFEYTASNGKEFFISFHQDTEIIGFCRLRFPSKCLRSEITPESAIVRELHVYGPAVDLQKQGRVQHHGFGKRLLQKAEEICVSYGKKKLIVIAGVGVREYYKRLGYYQDGPYVSKDL